MSLYLKTAAASGGKRVFLRRIMRPCIGLLALFLSLPMTAAFAGESHNTGLQVRNLPPTGKAFRKAPYVNMWYYRTEVHNATGNPLRIIWFEGYGRQKGRWVAANVLGRPLRGKDFAAWYTEGDPAPNGMIGPGKTAACDVNWTGTDKPEFVPTKWAYLAVDDNGNDYYAEAVVSKNIVKHVHYSGKALRHRARAAH